jgi:hypothetical protein
MRARIVEQLLSILFVGIVLATLSLAADALTHDKRNTARSADAYLSWSFMDFGNPMHRELFRESLEVFPGAADVDADSLLSAIEARRRDIFSRPELKTGVETGTLSPAALGRLGGMYAEFVMVYVLVLLITYQAAQAIAMYRFIHEQQKNEATLRSEMGRGTRTTTPVAHTLRRVGFLLLRGVLYAILFAPAYVIAYTLRSRFETNTLPFMIGLGVISNGLLVAYANKLYALLVSESKKGYIQTAIVKNLRSSYAWGTKGGISRSSLFAWQKRFPDHVFDHIFRNAHYQWIPTLKEHGAFLVTGLIIIEMALNIQGRLCYELLQQILYHHFSQVALIFFLIFLVVKATEISVDIWMRRNALRYDNAS